MAISISATGQSGKFVLLSDNEDIFQVYIDNIIEMDSEGKKLGTGTHSIHSVASLDFEFTENENDTSMGVMAKVFKQRISLLDGTAELIVHIYIFQESGEFTFGENDNKFTHQVKLGTVKFSVEVKNWVFLEHGATLQVNLVTEDLRSDTPAQLLLHTTTTGGTTTTTTGTTTTGTTTGDIITTGDNVLKFTSVSLDVPDIIKINNVFQTIDDAIEFDNGTSTLSISFPNPKTSEAVDFLYDPIIEVNSDTTTSDATTSDATTSNSCLPKAMKKSTQVGVIITIILMFVLLLFLVIWAFSK